ncbi:MAG: acyl-CoA thioesterase [Oscillospiraceae bacterium]|jgi:acyl-CoA thioester hydrolase|nr:acyl-CoA thioesterase [Oscillospiraceae bacterium]
MKTTTTIDTRYPECDKMGIIHHAVYPVWYEVARMEFFAALGFSFTDMQALGVNPAMVDLHLQYKAPVGYPGTVTITTSIAQVAPRKLLLRYELRGADGEIVNLADTFHVWTGSEGRAYNIEENLPEVYAKLRAAADQ